MIGEILPLKDIKQGLKDKKLYVVGKEIGVSYPILKKLADGVEHNYTINTLKSVSDYIRKGGLNE